MSRLEAFVIRCADPARLAPFYAMALGLPVDPADAAAIGTGTLGRDEAVLLGSRQGLHGWLIRSQAERTDAPAVHFDIRLDEPGERDALERLGASHRWFGPDGRWETIADPEGHLLCVFPPDGSEALP